MILYAWLDNWKFPVMQPMDEPSDHIIHLGKTFCLARINMINIESHDTCSKTIEEPSTWLDPKVVAIMLKSNITSTILVYKWKLKTQKSSFIIQSTLLTHHVTQLGFQVPSSLSWVGAISKTL